MVLIPIKEHLDENKIFTDNPDCQDSIYMSVAYYKKIGFNVPWICYYAESAGVLVGCAAYKGAPVNRRVEIAYGVFGQYYNQGIGKQIAAKLVDVALRTDPLVIITARTLPEENYSAKILRKNNFRLSGTVFDEEDGELWEWEHEK